MSHRPVPTLLLSLALLTPTAFADGAAPPSSVLTKEERTLLDLLNASRVKEKLTPVRANAVLTGVARAHSANMAKQGKMAHVLDDKTPGKRVLEAGYDYRRVGENVAWSEGNDVELKEIHEGWMNSKVHRDNILRPDFEDVGFGIARDRKGKVYYTQVFCRPMPPKQR